MLVETERLHGHLSEDDIRRMTGEVLSRVSLSGKRVLLIVPDLTRQAPIPLFFRIFYEFLGKTTASLDVMAALGTHQPMTEANFCERLGISEHERKHVYDHVRFYNHAYNRPDALTSLGSFSEDEIESISEGLMRERVDVRINKRVLAYDHLISLSPVVPHETAGFSGGAKMLYPGIAGADEIAFFHWLGAIITNPVINGKKYNPVRTFLNRAAALLDIPLIHFNIVIDTGGLRGLFIGDSEESWSKAADLSAKLHVKKCHRAYQSVVGVAPAHYTELWVAGKVMYKLEPVVADGGELIIYGSHVNALSHTFQPLIERIGYHVRDYFLHQMDRFSGIPRGVLAHSTNVRGIGSYENQKEKPRIRVTLATSIPESLCSQVNLGYRDPIGMNPEEWKNREEEGKLYVENAGGILYRLESG